MAEIVNNYLQMTVPELWNELNTKPHTVVDQYVINEIIKKKQTDQLICQANKNFAVKLRQYQDSCQKGISPNVVIKDNDNQPVFNISDFRTTQGDNKTCGAKFNIDDSLINKQLDSRFFDDVLSVKTIHNKRQKQTLEAPYQ